jgi:phosphoribosylformylglycinamidine (FGAM) synthase PurS component
MRLLRGLGYKVESVSVSKVYTVTFESETLDAAWSKADEISRRVLSNPTKDRYTVAVEAHP